MKRALTPAQRIAWLRLIRSENVGPVSFRELVNQFGGAENALQNLPDLYRRGGGKRFPKIMTLEAAQQELQRAEQVGAKLCAIGEEGYPFRLSMVDVPPPLIYGKGKIELADANLFAIVGSRNASAIGQKFTRRIASQLGDRGFVIVSGLARGIDQAAHQAALDQGTIAVLAGGIDTIYPPEHADLQKRIGEQGLLISEQPPGTLPRGQDFPRRNRIISGTSAGVLVIEAAQRSGSLITARFAAEQGREVFAVPGNPLDPRAVGPNRLIKDGATLVSNVDDIVEVLRPVLSQPPKQIDFELDDDHEDGTPADLDIDNDQRQRLIQSLSTVPVDIDELIRATNIPARIVAIILLELELAGRLHRHGRQLVSLAQP